MEKIRVSVPGSCGELVQGIWKNTPCLVSCPIDKMVEIEVSVRPGNGKLAVPAAMVKTQKAIYRALSIFDRKDVDVNLKRVRSLPESKGYASSTADILAALFGIARALGEEISPEQATQLALEIEPTDSLAWRELALLAYRNGQFMQPLGSVPSLGVLVLDWGGQVDTLKFNHADYESDMRQHSSVHNEAFEMLRQGIAANDIRQIGTAATISALAHQRILHKPQLEKLLKLADTVGAPGVCVAHSGTLTGILLELSDVNEAASYILKHLPANPEHYGLHKMIGGGPGYAR